MIIINKEKTTCGLLYLLSFLAFLSLCYYSNPIAGRLILLLESGVFFLLLTFNLSLVGERYKLIIIAVNLLSLSITLLLRSGVGVALAFFNLLVAVFVFNNLALSKAQKRSLHLLNVLFLSAFYLSSKFEMVHGRVAMWDFSGVRLNSNVVGMLLLALLFHAFNYVSSLRLGRKTKTFLHFAVVFGIGYLVFLSGCRSALLSLAVFLALVVFDKLYKKAIPYRYYRNTAILILFASLLFTVVYVRTSYFFENITILNKNFFSGRETVWQSAFGLISEHPVFGNGTDVLLDTVDGGKTPSAHNMLLSLWYTIGVIPTATIMLFFVNRNRKTERENRDRITQFALIASLVICFFESFYADPTLQIFFIMFLLSNVKTKDQDKEEIK